MTAFARFIPVFLLLGLVRVVIGLNPSVAVPFAALLWLFIMIVSWGFGVRFWDRTVAVGGGPPATPDNAPRSRSGAIVGLAAVGMAWSGCAALWVKGIREVRAADAEARAANAPCRPTPLTSVSAGRVGVVRQTGAGAGITLRLISDGVNEGLRFSAPGDSTDLELVPAAPVRYVSIGFSPDNNFVFYVTEDANGARSLFQVPALGGPRGT